MDKYEYSLKLDQLKTLCAEGKYDEAAEVADSINWNKIKNVNALVKAGEIYEKVGRYEDSREILLNAYDRSPIGRTIIYRLAEVAIKMGDFNGAQEYYDEFVDIAPHDNQRYVLKYNIRKAQNASPAELVPILEDLKEQEYTEEWAFELAYLYHKTGEVEKCIDACDELILWFGDGPYVEHALELKMLYQPLSKVQEEKYRRFRHEREGKTVIGAEEMARAGEYIHESVAIPQVTLNPSRFNTTNLQKEIAKGMQQIMDATEKETVVGTMDNIKKIVEEIPYLQLPREESDDLIEAGPHIETDEEIDGSLKINFQELLGEDSDGQISLVMSEKARLEQQITGQMTIAEVLEEWERTKRAAETALKDVEQRKLESAKARALQEAEDIMERLNDVLPKIEAGVSPKELLEEEYLQKANAILDEEIARLNTENELLAAEIAAEVKLGQTIRIEEDDLEAIKAAVADLEEPEEEPSEVPEIPEQFEELASSEESKPMEELEQTIASETDVKTEEPEALEESETKELETEELETEEAKEVPTASVPRDSLTEEQKAIFSYFVPVKGMEAQLCKALSGIVANYNSNGGAAKGNLIIQGSEGCGKTVLATSIVRVLQKECGHPNGKVGKIYADALNKKDVQQLLRKVAGGCLIIERAGELDRKTAVTLSLLLEQDSSGLLVILEDTAAGIKKALATDDEFAKKFTEQVTVPIFKNDDLVTFAKAYANELGYVIDEMAILALHNRITNIEKLDQATTLVEIKEIIDDAIDCEAHSGLRKFVGILTANRYTDDEKIVLREKDFE
ncbi:MAG: tetratricopeptide repeat protein [Agathobacter sp.]|nr:tetratricopeptide repeat protein [Agathobacter sp.]